MKSSMSINVIEKVITLEEATEKLGGKSALADAVGKQNQNFNRWIGKKLVVKAGSKYCLVENSEFWRAFL